MAKILRTFSQTITALRALNPPIDTWSSLSAEVSAESVLDGWQSTLFSELREAAVFSQIIMPEHRPEAPVKNGGKPRDLAGFNILFIRT